MITRELNITINPTPREIEKEIWGFDSVEQSDLILAMAQRFKNERFKVLMQLEYFTDSLKSELTKEEYNNVVDLFETIVNYLEGDNNND